MHSPHAILSDPQPLNRPGQQYFYKNLSTRLPSAVYTPGRGRIDTFFFFDRTTKPFAVQIVASQDATTACTGSW